MATVFRRERASAISKVTLLSLSHFPENCCPCRCAGLGAGHPGERPGPSGEARLACGKSSLPRTDDAEEPARPPGETAIRVRTWGEAAGGSGTGRQPVPRFARELNLKNAVTKTNSKGRKLPPGGVTGVAGSARAPELGSWGAGEQVHSQQQSERNSRPAGLSVCPSVWGQGQGPASGFLDARRASPGRGIRITGPDPEERAGSR